MNRQSQWVAAVACLVVSGAALARIEISTPVVAGQVATFASAHETSRND